MVLLEFKNDLRSSLFSENLESCTVFEFLISSGMEIHTFTPLWAKGFRQVPCGILAAVDHDSGECCNCGCLTSFGP